MARRGNGIGNGGDYISTVTIHVVSDGLGETGRAVAQAIAAQFPLSEFIMELSSHVRSVAELRRIVEPTIGDRSVIFLYTFARGELHDEMDDLVKGGAVGVDILGPACARIERLTGDEASGLVGALRRTDQQYFDRIDAMEYSVNHDDGRHPDGWIHADVILLGVSRTSKTPLSMYLAYRGLRTANIPLVPGSEPAEQLFQVDPRRIYGLVTDPELLLEIRRDRMREMGALVPDYADREAVEAELAEARALMRRLGCIVINTANRAIEEVAQEILRYVSAMQPLLGDRGPKAHYGDVGDLHDAEK